MELGQPDVWEDPDRAQALGKERSSLELVVKTIEDLDSGVSDCRELLDLSVEEDDQDSVDEVSAEIERLDEQLQSLEFRRMFSGEVDERLPRYPVRLRRHRSPGLGGNGTAHVLALG